MFINKITHGFVFLCTILIFCINVSQGASFPDKPADKDFFVDTASLISPEHATEINKIAKALLKEEQVPLYVVTISSLVKYGASSEGIEKYAQMLFDEWGIGYKDRNYGMLLVVSVGDRKARIELGKDWNNRHNQESKEVMQSLIIPAFKRFDYSTGIVDGVRGMNSLARGLQLPKPTTPWWFWPVVIAGLIGIILLIRNLFKTGRSGWAWALIAFLGVVLFWLLRPSMNSGGSGSGFGGGSSGGGGATGSW